MISGIYFQIFPLAITFTGGASGYSARSRYQITLRKNPGLSHTKLIFYSFEFFLSLKNPFYTVSFLT